jgi:hypothetical protein
MPARIVTSTYRYKRPPRKRKAVPLEGPAIVTLSSRLHRRVSPTPTSTILVVPCRIRWREPAHRSRNGPAR